MASLLASITQLQNEYPVAAIPLTYYQNMGSGAVSNAYFRLSGTSRAAPVVSATLLLQQNPQLTPDQVKVRLMKTASKTFPPLQRSDRSGYCNQLHQPVRYLHNRGRLGGHCSRLQ
jgi:hypothetical protein